MSLLQRKLSGIPLPRPVSDPCVSDFTKQVISSFQSIANVFEFNTLSEQVINVVDGSQNVQLAIGGNQVIVQNIVKKIIDDQGIFDVLMNVILEICDERYAPIEHGDECHVEDYSKIPHGDADHSETYSKKTHGDDDHSVLYARADHNHNGIYAPYTHWHEIVSIDSDWPAVADSAHIYVNTSKSKAMVVKGNTTVTWSVDILYGE